MTNEVAAIFRYLRHNREEYGKHVLECQECSNVLTILGARLSARLYPNGACPASAKLVRRLQKAVLLLTYYDPLLAVTFYRETGVQNFRRGRI